MKNFLLIFFILFCISAFGQYNPSGTYLTNLNKPIGLTSKPDGGRTYYYDAVNFMYRPFISVAEANTWLVGGARQGHFHIIINTGGTLSGGVLSGGTNAEYWYKDGIADINLVPIAAGTVTGLTFPSGYGYTASVGTPGTTPAIGFVLDTNHTSGIVSWPGLRAQGYGTGGAGTVTSVSGLSPLFAVSSPTTTPTFVLSPSPGTYRLFGSNSSTTPSYLAFIDSNYIPTLHTQAYYNTLYKNILSGSSDSIKGLPVDTSARRDTWVLSFDSTNHKWYLAAPGTGGGGTGLSSLNSQTGSTQTFATGTSGSNFNISSGSNVHTFNFPNASASNRGLLTSADWSTFNGKQNAGNYITGLSGDGSASGPGGAAFTLTSIITAGSCTYCNLTYDVKGRVTAAANGTSPPLDTSGGSTLVTYLGNHPYVIKFNPHSALKSVITNDTLLFVPDSSDLVKDIQLSGANVQAKINGAWVTKFAISGGGGAPFLKDNYNIYNSPTENIIDSTLMYVDGVYGNNSNSGSSSALPKKTITASISAINSQAASAGNARLSLKDSSIFRENVGITNDGVRIGGYQQGLNKERNWAVLTGADTLKGGWTKTGGQNYVYQQSVTNSIGTANPMYDMFQVVEIDSVLARTMPYTARKYLVLATSIGNCDSTAGSFYFNSSGCCSTSQLVYIHASDNTAPSQNTFGYEVATRPYSINTSESGSFNQNTWITNLIVRDAAGGYGMGLGPNSYLKNIASFGGGTHNIVMNGGTIENAVIKGGANGALGQTNFAFYKGNGAGMYNKAKDIVILGANYGFLSHQAGLDGTHFPIEAVDVNNAYLFSSSPKTSDTGSVYGVAFGGEFVKTYSIKNSYATKFGVWGNFVYGNIYIEKCAFTNISYRSGFNSPSNQVGHLYMNNTVIHNRGTGNGLGMITLSMNQSQQTVDVRNSIFYAENKFIGAHVFMADVGAAGETNVQSSIFISKGIGAGVNTLAVPMTNNRNSTSAPFSLNIKSDYNIYIVGPGSAGFQWTEINPSLTISTLSQWQTETGQDLHSIVIDVSQDPNGLKSIFIDPDNGNWSLLPIGNKWADTIRARRAGLTTPLTSYPQEPTLEDAMYTMQNGNLKNFASYWQSSNNTNPYLPAANDAVFGAVQPSKTYFRVDKNNKLTTIGGAVDIQYTTGNNLINNNQVYYGPPSSTGAWANYGIGNKKLPANTDASYQYYLSADSSNKFAWIYLSTANSSVAYTNANVIAATMVYVGNNINYIDGTGGSITSTGIVFTPGTWLRIHRTVSGTMTLETSPDEYTWTVIYTFSTTSTADLYMGINTDNSNGIPGHIFYPKCYNCVISGVSTGSGTSQWTTTGSNIYYNTGGVIIGSTSLPSGGYGLFNSGKTLVYDRMNMEVNPTGATFGVLNLGLGGFAGSAGHFSGNSVGTIYTANIQSTDTQDFLNFGKDSSSTFYSKFKIGYTGNFTMPNGAGANKFMGTDASGYGSWQTIGVAQVTGAAPLASPTLTGTPLAPTAASGTNTTQIATTAFVYAATGGHLVSTYTATTSGTTPVTIFTLAVAASNTAEQYEFDVIGQDVSASNNLVSQTYHQAFAYDGSLTSSTSATLDTKYGGSLTTATIGAGIFGTNSFPFKVTGETGKTINWSVTVRKLVTVGSAL